MAGLIENFPGMPQLKKAGPQEQQQEGNPYAGEPNYAQQPAVPGGAGYTGQLYTDPGMGIQSQYTPNPEMTTNQYQTVTGGTGGSGTSVDGQGSITKPAYENQQQAQLNSQLNQQELEKRAALSDKAWKARFAMVSPYAQDSGHVNMGPGGEMNDQERAARAAAFSRAKEQSGQTGLAALNALKQSVENTGRMGSSYEAQGLGGIIGGVQGGVNDFTREQLIQDLNRAAGIADETYQGNITQRGQDLARQQAIIGLLSAGSLY